MASTRSSTECGIGRRTTAFTRQGHWFDPSTARHKNQEVKRQNTTRRTPVWQLVWQMLSASRGWMPVHKDRRGFFETAAWQGGRTLIPVRMRVAKRPNLRSRLRSRLTRAAQGPLNEPRTRHRGATERQQAKRRYHAAADGTERVLADLKPPRLAPAAGATPPVYKVQPFDRNHDRPVVLGSDPPVRCSGRRLQPQAVLMARDEVRFHGAQGHDRGGRLEFLVCAAGGRSGTPLGEFRFPEDHEISEHDGSGHGLKAQCQRSILHRWNSSKNMAE